MLPRPPGRPTRSTRTYDYEPVGRSHKPQFSFERDEPHNGGGRRRERDREECCGGRMQLLCGICLACLVLVIGSGVIATAIVGDELPSAQPSAEEPQQLQPSNAALPPQVELPSVRDFVTSTPLNIKAHWPHSPPSPDPSPPPPAIPPSPQPLTPPLPPISPPPSPFPPLVAAGTQAVLDRLNWRFAHGRPSNAMGEVGVLVHQIDALDETHVGENPTPWLPCVPRQGIPDEACASSRFADHISASVLNPKVPFVYSDDAVGFVVAPGHAVVRCSFPSDGGTMSRYCQEGESVPADCLPGCYSVANGGKPCANQVESASKQYCFTKGALAVTMTQSEKYAMKSFDNNNGCRQGNGCRYNEIVLERAPWTHAQPHATEAIFYPVGGDAAMARKVHQAFLRQYGVTAEQVPLLRLNLDTLERRPVGNAPFESPVASDGYVTKPAVCAALYKTNSKLWRMFGSKKPWMRSSRGEKRCWHYRGGSDAFFQRVLNGDGCATTNWLEGVEGTLGEPYVGGLAKSPDFASPAPALLGFDKDVHSFCSGLLKLTVSSTPGDPNSELARRCVDASQNVMRLMKGWSMCSQMEWLVCAARGKLPGQETPARMHFATAPYSLTIQEWDAPKSYPCDDKKDCGMRYTANDIFYAEACILLRICRNGAELFNGLARGQPWMCELHEEGYHDFVRDLLRNGHNIDTRVEDYYSPERRR